MSQSNSEYFLRQTRMEKPVKPWVESLEEDEQVQEFSETLQGRKALERWAKLQDESQGC